MTQIVLATHNAHKVAELQAIVARVRPDIEVVGYDGPEPVEDGTSFQANALIKARTAAAHTGLVALADDSGVCVDVLGGSPGIFSAYWAGHAKDDAANLALLLDQISDLERDEDRGAHYTSVIALVTPQGHERTVEGIWPGRIAREPRGGAGFGYDPIFVPEGDGRTAAELTAEEKNAVSHRARALEALVPLLAEL
ncbi:MAG TPA: RdgB/HAM1 family non-canonical purine NTP pyrophosphatase [Candidatus Microbacterium stercoravium]|uniref:dITP/XTP pyrophosphatase n=1 Tax=Candidatus Microbacterium stercoravium TaxID=2838697 RepID=A0A9D2H3Q8_9MICO|nr:RdgB/HAM1 family non-canonical purine NTP pyrophosphatase [Candidatus Microbacterium stercoravium]